MNGRGLIVAVISVGVALGGLMLRGFSRIDTEIVAMRGDIAGLRDRMNSLEVTLTERMARLEGLFEGHVKGDCNE